MILNKWEVEEESYESDEGNGTITSYYCTHFVGGEDYETTDVMDFELRSDAEARRDMLNAMGKEYEHSPDPERQAESDGQCMEVVTPKNLPEDRNINPPFTEVSRPMILNNWTVTSDGKTVFSNGEDTIFWCTHLLPNGEHTDGATEFGSAESAQEQCDTLNCAGLEYREEHNEMKSKVDLLQMLSDCEQDNWSDVYKTLGEINMTDDQDRPTPTLLDQAQDYALEIVDLRHELKLQKEMYERVSDERNDMAAKVRPLEEQIEHWATYINDSVSTEYHDKIVAEAMQRIGALEESLALRDASFNLLQLLYNREVAKQVRVKPNKSTGENRGDDNSRYNWVAGGGGSEREFKGRTGDRLIYLWNNVTGEHAHFNITKDTFLTNEQLTEEGLV
jgi:hypothetical protein